MKLLLIFPIFLLMSFALKRFHCKSLSDGIYDVQFTDDLFNKHGYTVRIFDNNYTKRFKNGDSVSGTINWVNECKMFRFSNDPMPDTSTPLLKKLFGNSSGSYIELSETASDTIWFRTIYWVGQHDITENRGCMIKIYK